MDIKELAKKLCDESGCHHKCKEIDECVVMEEAELLLTENKPKIRPNPNWRENKNVCCGLCGETRSVKYLVDLPNIYGERVLTVDACNRCALLLINENKSNNFDVKSNEELFKQALVEGVNNHIDKTIGIEKQIEEMANTINEMDEPNAHYYGRNLKEHEAFADCFTIAKHLYNAGYRKQSEDTVEVVRCKNCVWWEAREYGSTIGRCQNPHNGLISEYSDDNDFCSYGEMKGGEE